MKNRLSRVIQLAGEQINSSDARRGAFICWMSTPAYLLLALWCSTTLWASHYWPQLANPALLPILYWSLLMALILTLLGLYGITLHGQLQRGRRYAALLLYFYTITTLFTCFLVGPLNIITGLVMMSASMIGMMLFPVRRIVLAFTAGLALLLLLSFLSVAGVIPYRPLLNGGPQGYYMILSCILGAVVYVIYEAAIMASLIDAWRQRELGVRQLSVTDTLTGVANRRHILEILAQQLSQPGSGQEYIGLIMADIDHFKRINDDFGHQAGDEALVATARVLRDCLRLNDIIGRYGGEEFLVVLPGATLSQARQIAERCCSAISGLNLPVGTQLLSLTASLGVVSLPIGQVKDMDALIQIADTAMYEAKKQGRNRVVEASSRKI